MTTLGRRTASFESRARARTAGLDWWLLLTALAVSAFGLSPLDDPNATLVPFTAQTRMSGVDFEGRRIRKGAADSVRRSAPFHQSFDARLGRRV